MWIMKRAMGNFWIAAVVLAVVSANGATAHAATITVQNTADSGAGSLRQAVADTVAGDIIKFAPSVTGTITLNSRIIPAIAEVTIVGPGAGKLTLSGGQVSGILGAGSVNYSKLTLSGLTVASATNAIWWVGDMVVNDCVFRDNTSLESTAPTGAAIDSIFGDATLTRCTFLNNAGAQQGGAVSFRHEQLTLNQCTFRNNSATGYGGALLAMDAFLTITNSTFANNSAGRGGALFHHRGSHTAPSERSTITRSTFSGNTAFHIPTDSIISGFGGAMFTNAATLDHCTLSGNTAEGNSADLMGGGAIYGSAALFNCTVAGNSAPNGFGGGIIVFDANEITLKNTIVAGNTAASGPDISGTVTSQDYNLIQNTAGATITGTTTNDKYGVDPRLGSLSGYGGPTETRPLLAGSPAIDGGNPVETATTDQRGLPRLKDGDGNGSAIPDIGAFEVQSTFSVSGRVTTSNNVGVSGATVTLGGLTTQTNGTGDFVFAAVPPGGHVVRPTFGNFQFTPGSRTVYVSSAAITGQNFVGGHSISGRIANSSGVGLANVSVTRNGSATPVLTNGAGYYTFSTLVPGNYNITPSQPATTFLPASRSVNVTSNSASGQNFVAAVGGFSVSGRIANSRGIGLVGVTVTRTGGFTAVTNGAGYFTFTNVPNGSHTLTPSGSGLTFSPGTKTATVNGGNLSGLNFIGATP